MKTHHSYAYGVFLALAFLLIFGLQAGADNGVLQSSSSQDSDSKNSVLVSSGNSAPALTPNVYAQQPSTGPQATVRIRVRPKPSAAAEQASQYPTLPAGYAPTPAADGSADATQLADIFKSTNPNAVKPQGTSPFIK